jgi:hypothetical protein
MNHQKQKIITTISVAVAAVGGFEALIYTLRLNEIFLFLRVSLYIYIFLVLKIAVLYDLHFKGRDSWKKAKKKHESVRHRLTRTAKIWLSAIHGRFRHIVHWTYFRQFHNYILLPSLVYWGTIGIIYLVEPQNFYLQQTFALLSGAALIVCYWYLKEIFYQKKDKIEKSIFQILTVIKLYAAFLLFTASLGVARNFCLDDSLYLSAVFVLTFWLLYQAMFQHNFINANNLVFAFAISAIMMLFAFAVYRGWGVTDTDYLTAGIFLVSWYNFFWGIFHHYLDKEKFSGKVFLEMTVLALLVSSMMVSITNFKARLLFSC